MENFTSYRSLEFRFPPAVPRINRHQKRELKNLLRRCSRIRVWDFSLLAAAWAKALANRRIQALHQEGLKIGKKKRQKNLYYLQACRILLWNACVSACVAWNSSRSENKSSCYKLNSFNIQENASLKKELDHSEKSVYDLEKFKCKTENRAHYGKRKCDVLNKKEKP